MEKESDLVDGLVQYTPRILDLVDAKGVAITGMDGGWRTLGETPSQSQLYDLAIWLSENHAQTPIFFSSSLANEYSSAKDLKDSASGILALKLPKSSIDYIFWFRPEVIQTITWAGSPEKSVSFESGTARLHPRKSFSEWKQLVQFNSLPWAEWEIEAAQKLGHSIISIDLNRQFKREMEAREIAESANQQKEHLLAVVSHDLKNPLTSLKINIALIQKTMPPDSAKKFGGVLSGIQRSLERMTHLIDDLLSITKLEAGTDTLEIRAHSAVDLLKDTFDLHYPIASEKGIRLLIDPEIPNDCNIFCDRERMLQVFSNLVGNAIKFTSDQGIVRLSLKILENDVVRFGVTDSGSGISQENLKFIFDRFWQARQTQRLGTGLGLSIAKAIVEAHGGNIWVESELGKGSTFYFSFTQSAKVLAA
jgi:light-regulated signal transduction histidine kinase (bacteriophytochrome)